MLHCPFRRKKVFLSTLSLRRATSRFPLRHYSQRNFYPRSPCGERPFLISRAGSITIFLSTLSLRRATRTETSFPSISRSFLSTLSLRRATAQKPLFRRYPDHFYPRSPCGERQHAEPAEQVKTFISIHALLAESDTEKKFVSTAYDAKFLSTLSLRRATDVAAQIGEYWDISIHALLAESDSKSAQNSGALLRIWNKFYGDCIFMLTGKAVFYPFCPCFFHIFWCEGTGNFMIAFPSH